MGLRRRTLRTNGSEAKARSGEARERYALRATRSLSELKLRPPEELRRERSGLGAAGSEADGLKARRRRSGQTFGGWRERRHETSCNGMGNTRESWICFDASGTVMMNVPCP